MIGTSSIDTTCTIWDVNTQTARTQLIAHDREVFDIAFSRGTDVFASVGADGSVRMFDLRSLEHSTIIYETPNLDPLLRLEWNKQDPNYLATFKVDSRSTLILDVRVPSTPVTELFGHNGCVNAVAWAPHSSCHICTAGDDSQALIWDLSKMAADRPVEDPILAYNAEGEVNNLQWSSSQPDWVSIAFSDNCVHKQHSFTIIQCRTAWNITACLSQDINWHSLSALRLYSLFFALTREKLRMGNIERDKMREAREVVSKEDISTSWYETSKLSYQIEDLHLTIVHHNHEL
eukprot:scaffold1803_cov195-Alexandrium_tamarense.AAC.20